MNLKNRLYQLCTWMIHAMTAWNTGGENIHSPYLFEWVRMIMYDTHAYYSWADIEQCRCAMLESSKALTYVDYGCGKRTHTMTSQRMVRDIAQTSLEPSIYAQLLFRLVNWMGHQAREQHNDSLHIVELGTSLGITTAYLASADSRNQIVTFEGCHEVAEEARANWEKLQLHNIQCVEGDIDVTLQNNLPAVVDIAFIDANHTYEATMRYFNTILHHIHNKSVVVIDDIYHSPEMRRAWGEVCRCNAVTTTMDIWRMGIVFFDANYLHKQYKLRL